MRAGIAVTALLAALGVSACATMSRPERSAYDQARIEVGNLEADPLANQAAGEPLQRARTDMANADTAARHHDASGVMAWSYLATREGQIGQAMISELRTRNQIADAGAQRERLLLDMQRRRAELAQQRAATAEERAQNDEQQLQQAQQLQQQQQQAQQLAQVRNQAQQQIDEAQARAQQAEQQTEQARQQAQQLQAQQLQAQQLQQAQAEQREQQAQAELERLQGRQTAQGMVITLGGSLLFATGKDTLEPGAVESLNQIVDFLQQHPMVQLRIEGFTDNRGSDALNDALSERRAQAVATALQADGVPASRLQPIGRGASLPVASNTTSAGRLQNRRVELLFSNTEGRFASSQPPEALR